MSYKTIKYYRFFYLTSNYLQKIKGLYIDFSSMTNLTHGLPLTPCWASCKYLHSCESQKPQCLPPFVQSHTHLHMPFMCKSVLRMSAPGLISNFLLKKFWTSTAKMYIPFSVFVKNIEFIFLMSNNVTVYHCILCC